MKKLLFSLSITILIASCGGEKKPPSQKPDISITSTKKTQTSGEAVCKKGYDQKATKIGFGGFLGREMCAQNSIRLGSL